MSGLSSQEGHHHLLGRLSKALMDFSTQLSNTTQTGALLQVRMCV